MFANTVLMYMLGFNAQIRSQGLCKRGQHARSDDKDPPKPYCVQTLANVIDRFSPEESESLLNGLTSILASKGFFDTELSIIIDATDVTVPSDFKDMEKCGTVARTHKIVDRHGRIQQVETFEKGFKVIAAYWHKGRIPLAV